jgi:very-short-patch-repair endonuclease
VFKDISPKPRPGRIGRVRRLRRELSLPEGLLWRELRNRPDGLKFRRQHPSGVYILDFYCSDARLAIEIDGFAHGTGNRPAHDETRDAWFAQSGIATLRIPAQAVLEDLQATILHIVTEARVRIPLHHPAMPGGPPPRDELGEE